MTISSTPAMPLVVLAVEAAQLPLGELPARSAQARLQVPAYERICPKAIADNRVLQTTLQQTKQRGGRVHLIGMLTGHAVSPTLHDLLQLTHDPPAEGSSLIEQSSVST